MLFNEVELTILIKNQPITEYRSNESAPRTFVEGRPGSAYELRVHNHSFRRVEVILSVDGLAISDGKPAGSESPGFVVEPRQSINLPGWMLDDRSAAAFVFAGKQSSYAAQSGEPVRNVGVIGAMMFAERVPTWRNVMPVNFIPTSSNGAYVSPSIAGGYNISTISSSGAASSGGMNSADMAPQSRSAQPPPGSDSPYAETSVQNLGTGFGGKTAFHTTTVNFERGMALGTILIYYDDRRGLKAHGIVLERHRVVPQTPDAFPARRPACVPPIGWRD